MPEQTTLWRIVPQEMSQTVVVFTKQANIRFSDLRRLSGSFIKNDNHSAE
jgi:hypothetical protein